MPQYYTYFHLNLSSDHFPTNFGANILYKFIFSPYPSYTSFRSPNDITKPAITVTNSAVTKFHNSHSYNFLFGDTSHSAW
jgi:hypothetical protein